MDSRDIENRFGYHPADSEEVRVAHSRVRHNCGEVAEYLNGLLPESREKSLAITKLEEAMHWANKAIALHMEPSDG